jgi:predicted nucleic acid-binding protein
LHELYGTVTITPEVAKEFGEPLPSWIAVVSVTDLSKTTLIEKTLDLGEASAIAANCRLSFASLFSLWHI